MDDFENKLKVSVVLTPCEIAISYNPILRKFILEMGVCKDSTGAVSPQSRISIN